MNKAKIYNRKISLIIFVFQYVYAPHTFDLDLVSEQQDPVCWFGQISLSCTGNSPFYRL